MKEIYVCVSISQKKIAPFFRNTYSCCFLLMTLSIENITWKYIFIRLFHSRKWFSKTQNIKFNDTSMCALAFMAFKSHIYSICLRPCAKNLQKLLKLKNSSNHKRNINRSYNEKFRCNCLKQLPTLRLKT